MISSVYSYYLTQYGNKINAKYDSHSKKELKNAFSKVVQINSKAPTCKIDVSEAAQKYAIDLKENARELNHIANDLSDSDNGEMRFRKTAISDQPSVVDAEFVGDDNSPSNATFEVGVTQLASNQVNTGNYLQPRSKLLTPGTYSFDLDIRDLTYEFEIDVHNNETTKDVQDKISRLINRSNIGLNSEVSSDNLGNTAVIISSDSTGINGTKPTIFQIHSAESEEPNSQGMQDSNNLISTLGLGRVSNYPTNAVFTVNGEERFSQNNNITINHTYSLDFHDTTKDSPVTISLSTDSDSIVESIDELIDRYNNLLSVAADSDNDQFEGNQQLHKEFTGIVHSYSDQLSKSGLDISDDGLIQVNKEAIVSAAEDGSIGDVFTSLSSFKQAIQQKAEYISYDPMKYVNSTIIAYKNPRRITIDPYNLSAYTGMMFNDYIQAY